MGCCDEVCVKCQGTKWIVYGLVLFFAAWWAKSRGDVYLIWYTLAALVVLKGVMKLAMPGGCGHCAAMPVKKGKK